MATVVDEATGEEIEVVPVEATAVMTSINSLNSEFPQGAAKQIEAAIVQAINDCMEQGITNPKEIRERMMVARENMKKALRLDMHSKRSQEAAEEK
jgi:hypothetical protein